MLHLDSHHNMEGLCRCGCGEPAEYAAKHVRSSLRSDTRLQRYEVREMGYETPCHVWTGPTMGARNGKPGRYARIFVHGRYRAAHRYIYELEVGLIPDDLQIHHLCRVTLCVNADHLTLVTQQENIRQRDWNRLDEKTAALIRDSKLSGVEMAKQLGVSQSLISAVRHGQVWAVHSE